MYGSSKSACTHFVQVGAYFKANTTLYCHLFLPYLFLSVLGFSVPVERVNYSFLVRKSKLYDPVSHEPGRRNEPVILLKNVDISIQSGAGHAPYHMLMFLITFACLFA